MKIFAVCTSLLVAFFVISCGDLDTETGESFEYDLRGIWVPNDPENIYSGTLEIEYNRITITGYGESQTPILGDDDKRPFKSFTKGIALKGYSEDGKIFIEDRGFLQEGIPYTFWEENAPPDYKQKRFLSFIFDGREEKLQSQ